MRIAAIIARCLMGALFVFASVAYFFQFVTPPPMEGPIKVFNEGMAASVYMFPLVKAIELLCGVAFLMGRFVPLALVLIAPVVVNITLVHAFLDPKGLPVALFLVVAAAFLAYVHRDSYRPLFKAKA